MQFLMRPKRSYSIRGMQPSIHALWLGKLQLHPMHQQAILTQHGFLMVALFHHVSPVFRSASQEPKRPPPSRTIKRPLPLRCPLRNSPSHGLCSLCVLYLVFRRYLKASECKVCFVCFMHLSICFLMSVFACASLCSIELWPCSIA